MPDAVMIPLGVRSAPPSIEGSAGFFHIGDQLGEGTHYQVSRGMERPAPASGPAEQEKRSDRDVTMDDGWISGILGYPVCSSSLRLGRSRGA